MFEIKTDEKLPHHYIFSVGYMTHNQKNPGHIYLKHGPVYYNNDDVIKIQNVLILTNDKIYKEIYKVDSMRDLSIIMNCRELLLTFVSMQMSAYANNCSLHHFSSDVQLENEDWFVDYVELANKDENIKKRIMDAKI